MIVRCVRRDVPPSPPVEPEWRRLDLAVGTEYRVITIEYGDYRLLGESRRPYLYPSNAFDIVDRAWDDDWVSDSDSDGTPSIGPSELLVPGLFEDYFGKDPAAQLVVDGLLRSKGFPL